MPPARRDSGAPLPWLSAGSSRRNSAAPARLARFPPAAYVTRNSPDPPLSSPREPILRLPPVIAALTAALVLVHLARWALDQESDVLVLLWFAFIPARYGAAIPAGIELPGGLPADLWTTVTYAFLHGDWVHLGVNLVWLLAFGSPVAWRFGTARFLCIWRPTRASSRR
jgi:membrane associated rhomboid family serine protease